MATKELIKLVNAIRVEVQDTDDDGNQPFMTTKLAVPNATEKQITNFVKSYVSQKGKEETVDVESMESIISDIPKIVVEETDKIKLRDPKGKTFKKVPLPLKQPSVDSPPVTEGENTKKSKKRASPDAEETKKPKKTTEKKSKKNSTAEVPKGEQVATNKKSNDEDAASHPQTKIDPKLICTPDVYGVFLKYFQCLAIEVISPDVHKYYMEDKDVFDKFNYVTEIRGLIAECLGEHFDAKGKTAHEYEQALDYMKRTVLAWGFKAEKMNTPMICLITKARLKKGQTKMVTITVKDDTTTSEVKTIMSNYWVEFFEYWVNMARLKEATQKAIIEELKKVDPNDKMKPKAKIKHLVKFNNGEIVKKQLEKYILCFSFFFKKLPEDLQKRLLSTYHDIWFNPSIASN